jgi:hypothetical protein
VDYARRPRMWGCVCEVTGPGYVPFVTVRNLDELEVNPGYEPDYGAALCSPLQGLERGVGGEVETLELFRCWVHVIYSKQEIGWRFSSMSCLTPSCR